MGQLGLKWQMEKVNMVGARNVQPLAALAPVANAAVKHGSLLRNLLRVFSVVRGVESHPSVSRTIMFKHSGPF